MGTEILRPQDCLIERIRVPPARRTYYANYSNYFHNNQAATSRSSRKPVVRPDRRKRVAVCSAQPVVAEAALVSRRSSADDSRIANTSGSLMEKVTILRRGQSLDSSSMLMMKSDVYAGSAFAMSPSPSALPLPSFPTKKQHTADSATRDLRRLLRLE